MSSPMNYSLCTRTVTVYRKGEGGITRLVLPGCGYLHKAAMDIDATGHRQSAEFLLIVPGEREIFPGDRVLPGEGPAVSRWAELYHAPMIRTVKTHTWENAVCHREGRGS